MGFSGFLVGRLGKDPETRQAGKGTVTTLVVATDSGWGERKVTTWTRVEVWGRRGEAAAEHLSKGRAVECRGEVVLEEWDGRDGKRQTLKLVNADWSFVPRDTGDEGARREPTNGGGRAAPDEDIPF